VKLRILAILAAIAVVGCGNATTSPTPGESEPASSAQPSSSAAVASEDPVASGDPIVLEVVDDMTDADTTSAAADQVTTLKPALTAGQGPDVFLYDVGEGNAGVLVRAGLIKPVSEIPGLDTDALISDWALSQANFDGVPYGMPALMELLGIFWNDTLMAQEGFAIPETTDQLLEFCTAAKAKGYVPLAYTNNPGWQSFHQLAMISNNAIGSDALVSLLKENQGQWTDPALVSAVQFFFVDMVEAGCYPDDVNAVMYEDGTAMLADGRALGLPTGGWIVDGLEEAKKDPNWEYSVSPFPSINGGTRVIPATAGSAWFVAEKARNPEAAGRFISYLFSPEASKVFAEVGGLTPTGAFDPADLDVSPLRQFNIETLQAAANGTSDLDLGSWIDTVAPEEFLNVMQSGFQGVIAGSTTPEQQMQDLQAAWEGGQ
jgi:raffinose/stachyose/melibiose transport system substrate-binding protein